MWYMPGKSQGDTLIYIQLFEYIFYITHSRSVISKQYLDTQIRPAREPSRSVIRSIY